MNGTRVEPPEWLYLEARVLLLSLSSTGTVEAIHNGIVESIAPKSCVVAYRIRGADQTVRVRLDTLRSGDQGGGGTWDPRWYYEVVQPTSERGVLAQQLRDIWSTRNAAAQATKALGRDMDSPETIQAAVAALGRWHTVASSGDLKTIGDKLAGR